MFFLALNVLINWFVIGILISVTNTSSPGLYATLVTAAIIGLALSPIAEKINRIAYGCRPATKEERAKIEGAWEAVLAAAEEVDRGKYGKPEIFVNEQKAPNAFAIGSRTILVTKGLLEVARPEELAGVLAHELGHLRNGDTKRRAVAVAMNMAGNVAAWVLTIGALFFEAFTRKGVLIIFALLLKGMLWLFQRAADLGLLAVGRQEEFRADAYAKALGFGPGLVSFLRKIEVFDVAPQGLWAALSRSHPSTAVRIDKLTD